MALGLKGGADRADPAIHHVGRAKDIGTSLGLCNRHFDQCLYGAVVHNDFAFDVTVVTVDVIGIKGDVGHHGNLGDRVLDRPDRPVGQVVGVPGLGAILGAMLHRGIGEQADRRNAKGMGLFRGRHDTVHRLAGDAGHGGDCLFGVVARHEEHGPDEISRRKGGFAHHVAQRARTAHATRTAGGEGCGGGREGHWHGRSGLSGHTLGSHGFSGFTSLGFVVRQG